MPVVSKDSGGATISDRRTDHSQAALLWSVIVPLAAILRFLYLSRKSIYLDEALSVAYAHLSWHDFVQTITTRDANMALYYLLLRGMIFFGDSEFWVRLLSVLAGVVTIPLIYALGKNLYDRRTGLLAALLLSVNACHVVYSQEARGYALALLLTVLSSLLFLEGIESPSWSTWVWYALACGLSVDSHFYAGLVLAAQWLSLFALPRRMIPAKHIAVAIILIAILIFPALLFVLAQGQGPIAWLPPISWLEVYHTLVFLAAEGGKLAGNLLLVFCLIALGAAARQQWSVNPSERIRTDSSSGMIDLWKSVFPWYWLLAPMVITALGSLWKPMFFHRFLIVCLPAFVLLVARGLVQLRPRVVWIAAFVVLSTGTVFLSYSRTRENWRDAVQYVLTHAQPHDGIWFSRDYGSVPFEYYENRAGGIHPRRLTDSDLSGPAATTRLWAIFYPVAAESTQIESNLAARYPALAQSNFRGLRIVLFDVQSTR